MLGQGNTKSTSKIASRTVFTIHFIGSNSSLPTHFGIYEIGWKLQKIEAPWQQHQIIFDSFGNCLVETISNIGSTNKLFLTDIISLVRHQVPIQRSYRHLHPTEGLIVLQNNEKYCNGKEAVGNSAFCRKEDFICYGKWYTSYILLNSTKLMSII